MSEEQGNRASRRYAAKMRKHQPQADKKFKLLINKIRERQQRRDNIQKRYESRSAKV